MDAAHRRVLTASAVGSALEWYDFFIYGTAAALVFGEIFFPKSDPTVGTLLAFATFGVGFIARPFGGLVFGHLGDRIGRMNRCWSSAAHWSAPAPS
jgi:MFS family permease